MKRTIIFFIAAVMACACQKNPVNSICGSYSFKTGGVLEIVGEGLLAHDTVFHSSLVPESGQMRILPKGGDEIVVTMNILGGNPVVFNGKVSGEDIVLSPTEREVPIYNELSLLNLPTSVLLSVEGTGAAYGNTIIFSMDYTGNFDAGTTPCRILSSNVNCIATRNE